MTYLILLILDTNLLADSYINGSQQCSFSFLIDLIKSFGQNVLNLFTFKVINKYICQCGKTTYKNSNENFIYIYKSYKKSETFENLINNLGKPELIDLKCEYCFRPEQTKKTEYDFENCSYIIIRINDFNYVENSLIRYYTSITNFNCDYIKIFNNTFKLIASVNHTGGLSSGHYVCSRRVSGDWIEISDDKALQLKRKPGDPNLD